MIEPVPECDASLVILSEALSADEMEALIGLSPDRSVQRGDVTGASGRARSRFTVWRIGSGPSSQTPETQVFAVLDRVHDVADRIRSAANDPRIHSVALWVGSEDRTFALDLPADRVMEIARLGASLKIKVYHVDSQEGCATDL